MTTIDIDMKRNALITPCGNYRYWLSRQWDETKPTVTFIMMNPSTADASIDDHTIRKCIGFSKVWGYGSLFVVNLFALRSTYPEDLFNDMIRTFCDSCGHGWVQLDGEYTGPRPCRSCGSISTSESDAPWNPVGPSNDQILTGVIADSRHVVAAWGCEAWLRRKINDRSLADRPAQVVELIKRVRPDLQVSCLGMSRKGTPYHPLMLRYTTPLVPFNIPTPVTED